MIDELDKTIAELLKSGLPPELGDKLTVSFASPGAEFPPAALPLPAVNLFLYNLIPNTERRENAPVVQRLPGGGATKQRPPTYVDCSYLLSVWPDAKSSDPVAEEHNILGAVMKVLLANPMLPAELLHGSLPDTQTAPVAGKVASPAPKDPSEVWQSLGTRQKLSLMYTVTFSIPMSDPEETPLVTEKQLKFRTLGSEELQ